MSTQELVATLDRRIAEHKAVVGIVGMGYVGLPLLIEFAKAGFPVVGFDVDPVKVQKINAGVSYIEHITADKMQLISTTPTSHATDDFDELMQVDVVIICVPTPLTAHREPDMRYVESTTRTIASRLKKGQMIILESTTYPGTTREVLIPPLETASGLKAGRDFFVAFSPEREDPGNPNFSTGTIPKVVGGLSDGCLQLACRLYDQIVPKTVPVSSPDVAEACKLLENIFRSVNIALVNELKTVFAKMDINVWEVIAAASTKPFGYMPFYPGPGLGGHCIPIDPFYLTWRAREFACPTRFIELAGEVNTGMPEYVIDRVVEALNSDRKAVNGSKILVLGVAYKADVDDMRESPSLELIDLLEARGAVVDYHDPHVPVLPKTRKHEIEKSSVSLNSEVIKRFDAVLIATRHKAVDYQMLADHARLIIDTRNAMATVSDIKAKVFTA